MSSRLKFKHFLCEFETMFMGEEESVVDFAGKLSKVTTQLRSLREKIDDGVLVSKLLRAAPHKV